jgi:hypothetical protein
MKRENKFTTLIDEKGRKREGRIKRKKGKERM